MGSIFSTNNIGQTTIYNRSLPLQKGQVIEIDSSTEWRIHFESSKQTSKLMVVDFKNSRCEKCLDIEPAIDEFAEKYTDVDFIKIDVDVLSDVAQDFGVQAMPTFLLIKRGEIVDKVVGTEKVDLQMKIDKHRT